MICTHCHAENRVEAKFCDECGERLELACASCGEPNRPGAKFCSNCGREIARTLPLQPSITPEGPAPRDYTPKHLAKKILDARPTLERERKQVTVLFADIRGSTRLLEGRDPEEAQKLIDPVLQVMMSAVHRYEGTVNQILGDGIMALFGAPLAHEDHALRACYAALAMQEEMRRYRESVGQPDIQQPHIGIGLNSGEVVVRSIDNDLNFDFSAIGQTTHLAAGMQQIAGPGTILITAATLRQVEGFLQVKALDRVQVKGIATPVEAYELVGATAARTRIHAAAIRGLTPFVGRTAELENFQNLIQQAARGRGQVLAMVGEPGVGKSRLVHELKRSHLPSDWMVLEGASVSYGKATLYFPLVQFLRGYLSITDGEDGDAIGRKTVERILSLDEMLVDAIGPVLTLLDALPDLSKTPSSGSPGFLQEHPAVFEAIRRFVNMEARQRRRQTFDSLKRMIIRESQRQPLLLIFEDLQWTDEETQIFLDYLVESLPMARILLVVNYRPGYAHRWMDRTYYTQLRVEPLHAAGTEELLQHLLGSDPQLPPLKELLIKRTEGNPFFAEESVRSLVETGVLIGNKGAYSPGLQIENISIPTTVQSVVAERIDRLSTDEKHLLQTAAVIGVEVPFNLLRVVADLADDVLNEGLSALQNAEFLYESNLFPEVEYSFKHALTNEVAYGALPHDRRIFLHARIVRALEGTTRNVSLDHVEKLAHHAFQGELWKEAVIYLKEAGAKALTRSANRDAVRLFQEALDALGRLPEGLEAGAHGVDIRLELRNALFLLGEFDKIPSYLREAQRIAEALPDRCRLRRVWNCQLAHYSLTGEPHRVIELGTRALTPAMACDDPGLDIVTHYYMGIAQHTMGAYVKAMQQLEQAIDMTAKNDLLYERFGTSTIISVICRNWLVQSLAQLGAFDKGFEIASEGLRIGEEVGHPYSLAYMLCSLGFLWLLKGELNKANEEFRRCQKLCQDSNIRVLVPQINAYWGFARALSGNVTEALPMLETAAQQAASIGRTGGQSLRVSWQGECYLLSGRIAEAQALANQALELAGRHMEQGHGAWALKLLGDSGLSQVPQPSRDSESSYVRALTIARDLGMQPLQAHCHFGLGRLYCKMHRPREADAEFNQAKELYQAMGMNFWLPKVDTAKAHL